MSCVLEQCSFQSVFYWSDQRHLVFREFQSEGVFFQDGRVVPATRSVELRDQGTTVVYSDLVDPVLVTVEYQKVAVAGVSLTFDRRKNGVGIKVLVGEVVGRCHVQIPRVGNFFKGIMSRGPDGPTDVMCWLEAAPHRPHRQQSTSTPY